LGERFAECDEFTRSGEAQSYAASESFEIEDAAQFLADFAAQDGLLDKMGYGFETSFDGFTVKQRAQNPRAKEARAHSGDSLVERAYESHGAAARSFFREDWRDELEVADRDRIENESIVLFVVSDAVEMAKRFDAYGVSARGGARGVSASRSVFAEVVHNRASSGKCLGMILDAEAGQFSDAELFAKDSARIAALENPVLKVSLDAAGAFQK
jgi:hypothetical protein